MDERFEPRLVSNEDDYVEIDNVYEFMPPPGALLEMATEEEMAIAGDLECRHLAFMRLQDMNIRVDGDSYQALLADFLQFERESFAFWKSVAARLGIPYEWPIRIDHGNGPIYMGHYDTEE